MAINIIALIVCIIQLNLVLSYEKKNLTFLALQNQAVFTGVGAWLAIQEINNNSELLPNYRLIYKSFDTERRVQHTLRQALRIINIIEDETTEDNLYCPIILGPPWSSLAVTSAPVLNTFYMGLISESASSITLSDHDEYPYFYRFVNYISLFLQVILYQINSNKYTQPTILEPYQVMNYKQKD